MSQRVSILGLGARGQAWAVACLASGWRVRGFDPDPLAGRSLKDTPDFRREPTISAAVQSAELVFCCLPDRLELVQMVLQRAQAAAGDAAVVFVDTPSFDVDAVQACAIRPAEVFRVDVMGTGGLSLEATSRNADECKQRVKKIVAELAAVRSLQPTPRPGDYPTDAESA
ncbi:MAG: NAD(P)-binding domain-containing protein [Paracoccaceae bacterium]|nr:NAD(P)-binding domain-containing protein [Paracoccaceae bacterium]